MFKKFLAAAGVAGLLVLGTAAAANADADYTATLEVTAGDAVLEPGQSTVLTVNGVADGTVIFGTEGVGVEPNTLSSIAFAAEFPTSIVEKQAVNGSASATFTAPQITGTYVVTVFDSAGEFGQISITVGAVGSGGPGGSGGAGGGTGAEGTGSLPATGGNAIPAAAIWLGAGAVGLGGIAITAAVARRRAAANAE
ncbi:hypothetical protein FBY40_1132 [Microbacterium sp. SLBN-154]|uniref:hypothetical protein n=1 Tax=Microbacterium sp. SLBN-154 TaxID=2768458 RepID=UPI001153F47B|nr:hypothetical protein [Microbacterium sp. SLBN-154]TQK18643.1 hypothetical protein FBY40_1132 [Microbacterium sp. SLBN-154]